jgi:6,7-dimethyl-8-ribityllumazine synthase
MSGAGAPTTEPIDCSDLRVAVIAGTWHEEVTAGLLAGAERCLAAYSVTGATVLRVPGAFELPVVARELALKGYDAVVAFGVVIRGGTPHFDFVCNAATDGLTRVALDTGVPIGFGVLTCDTDEQALDRAGLPEAPGRPASREDKGWEATSAALVTAQTLKQIRRGYPS